jgi:integrase
VSARFALQRETLRTIVLLLYSTGLRAGEVSRLCIGDVDLAARTLFVRETKFFKSRLVPISESLAVELATYLEKRGALAATSPRAPFFISRCRRSIPPRNLSFVFHELVKSAGIAARPGGHGPRLHDLRHTFAVRRVLGWYRAGADVTVKLPLLATYLGHGNVLSTHVYLTATAELLREASGRFERAYGSLVVAGGNLA